jgi:DNA-binding CsgD family transcriptional regulator
VLYWLSNGKANRDIAEILGISYRTVDKHLEHLFIKIGVESRSSAVATALRTLGE